MNKKIVVIFQKKIKLKKFHKYKMKYAERNNNNELYKKNKTNF